MKVDMKSTEYYKSGKHAEHNRLMSIKAKKKNKELLDARIAEYNKAPNLCKNCKEPHSYEKRNNKFCSRSCSATYHNKIRIGTTRQTKTKDKISKSIKAHIKEHGHNTENMTVEQLEAKWAKQSETCNKRLLEQEFSTINEHSIKKRIMLEQDGNCNRCNLDEWQGEPLVLELEHKDGVHSNNERDNLECLCPNCHSLTDTWRGRNKNTGKQKVTDKEVCIAFLETGTIRQALLKVGLAAKGNNYGRAKRCLTQAGIKYK